MKNQNDWYKDNIESEVRGVVRLLRDNGVNTECSCGHKQYIQCQYMTDGFLMKVDHLLFTAGCRDYTIKTNIIREKGHLRTILEIDLERQSLRGIGEK